MKILVVTWGRTNPVPTLQTAAELSKAMAMELHVAYIWSLLPQYTPEFIDSTHCETQAGGAREALATQVETVEAVGGVVADTYLRLGMPDTEAAELGKRVGADMMVIGSQRLGLIKRLLSGHEAERIVRHAPCSVLVVRQDVT